MKFKSFIFAGICLQFLAQLASAAEIHHPTCMVTTGSSDFKELGLSEKGFKQALFTFTGKDGKTGTLSLNNSNLDGFSSRDLSGLFETSESRERFLALKLNSLRFSGVPKYALYNEKGQEISVTTGRIESHVVSMDLPAWKISNEQKFYYEVYVTVDNVSLDKIDERKTFTWYFYKFTPVQRIILYKSPLTSFQNIAKDLIAENSGSSVDQELKDVAQGKRVSYGENDDFSEPYIRTMLLLAKAGYTSEERNLADDIKKVLPTCIVTPQN